MWLKNIKNCGRYDDLNERPFFGPPGILVWIREINWSFKHIMINSSLFFFLSFRKWPEPIMIANVDLLRPYRQIGTYYIDFAFCFDLFIIHLLFLSLSFISMISLLSTGLDHGKASVLELGLDYPDIFYCVISDILSVSLIFKSLS